MSEAPPPPGDAQQQWQQQQQQQAAAAQGWQAAPAWPPPQGAAPPPQGYGAYPPPSHLYGYGAYSAYGSGYYGGNYGSGYAGYGAAYPAQQYQGASGYPPAGAPPVQPPPPQPPLPAEPPPAAAAPSTKHVPQWKAAADRVAAAAAAAKPNSWDGSMNAVPPPASLLAGVKPAGSAAAAQRPGVAPPPGLTIRPQGRRPGEAAPSGSAVVDAFRAAAARLEASGAARTVQQPAYISVGRPAAAPTAASALGPGSVAAGSGAAGSSAAWPPALKSYVERAFLAAPTRDRAKLQAVLRRVIDGAMDKGELWTRDWERLPLPDLTHRPEDSAALVDHVASMLEPKAAVPAGTGAAWAARSPAATAQQEQPSYAAAVAGNRAGAWRTTPTAAAAVAEVTRRRGPKRRFAAAEPSSDDEGRFPGSTAGGGESYEEQLRRARRAGRFAGGAAHAPGVRPRSAKKMKYDLAEGRRAALLAALAEGDTEGVDLDSLAIKGTCQSLEKSYFRLTSAPDRATVRPQPVLRAALSRLVGLIARGEVNYFYALDQFKGMRQDLTVQALRGPLAVDIYEAAARAALEYGDVAEYNQCQAQLNILHSEGLPGSREEFLAYRILYTAVHARHGEQYQLLGALRRLSTQDAALPEVAHALAVRQALEASDYPAFFRLYSSAPRLQRALMDLCISRVRFCALSALCKAFRPAVPVSFVVRVLGFQANNAAGRGGSAAGRGAGSGGGRGGAAAQQEEAGEPLPGCSEAIYAGQHAAQDDAAAALDDCVAWLEECCAVLTGGGAAANEDASSNAIELVVDCKASVGQLTMPADKEAVAHGDANLAIDDFLKSFQE